MNKTELIQLAAIKCDISQIEMTKALVAILETIDQSLAKDETISLSGFGTFSIKERAARKGVNPMTKEPIDIPEAKVVRFKPSKKKKK